MSPSDVVLYTNGLHMLQALIGVAYRESSYISFAARFLIHQACLQDSLKTNRLWYVYVPSVYFLS